MLRIVLVGGLFAISLPLIIAVLWLLTRFKPSALDAVSCGYYRRLCALLRLRVRVVGELARGRPVLVVANHVSWVDIVVLGATAPFAFVAKREVAGWPLFGTVARLTRTVFVDRTHRQQTGDAVAEIAQRLAHGHPVALFAEGTSSDGNRVLPFRSALVGAVEEACERAGLGEVLLQPLSICYTGFQGLPMGRQHRPLVAWYGDLDFLPHVKEFIRRGAVDAVVTFGAPIAVDGAANRKAVAMTLETSVRRITAATLRARASEITRSTFKI